MQAIVFTEYGSPDVLQLVEVAKPTPQPNEVLIKIHATATNPADWHLMRGKPFLARIEAGWPKPKTKLGLDIAGTIEAVGSSVTQWQPGDEVFGELAGDGKTRGGGFAEYACAKENMLARKPANVTFEEAASTPVVGFTAIQGMRDFGHIHAGQKVLINGASGGIGTFAVQYAKSVGAEVTGVCSTRNLELVRSLGADHVIDYTQADFTANDPQYDLIYDTVGNRSAAHYRRALKPGGICVVAGFTTMAHMIIQVTLLGALTSKTSNKTLTSMGTAQAKPDDLRLIKELLETGKVVPVIDRTFPLSATADAIRYLETGHARGKVIVQVIPSV